MRPFVALLGLTVFLSCSDSPTGPLRDPRGVLLVTIGSGAQAEVYAMRPDGTGRQRLTSNTYMDADPSWSPDGRQVVWISFRDSNPGRPVRRGDVFVMNADGSNSRRLVQVPEIAWHPRWSPDGTRISFEAYDPVALRFRGYVVNADGTNQRVIGDFPAESFHFEWSPDGSRFLFLSNRSPRFWWTLYTASVDGSGEQMVGGDAACPDNVGDASWSRDGSRIAYSCPTRGGIWTMTPLGTDVRLVAGTDIGGAYLPVWSPDGSQLAFNSNRDSPGFNPGQPNRFVWDVFVLPAGGGNPVKLTTSDTMHAVSSWGRP